MLEVLKFEVGGMAGFYSIEIENQQNHLVYQYRRPEDSDWHLGEIAFGKSEWLSKIEDVRIKSWKSEYSPAIKIFDGVMWSLEYKAEGKRWRHIRGDNRYPDTWNSLIALLNEVDSNFDLSDFISYDVPEFDLIPVTYGKLADHMEGQYVDYPRSFDGNFMISGTSPEFFVCVMKEIRAHPKDEFLDRNDLYAALIDKGYSEGCLEDIEWCLPKQYRAYGVLKQFYLKHKELAE